MHPQPESSGTRFREPTRQELALLRLICEQTAIPLDQLARFLGCEFDAAVCTLARLEQTGCIRSRRFLAGDSPWHWLSYRGIRLAGLGFPYKEPTVCHLAHRRAINAVRLHLAARAPEGRWLSERVVHRQRGRGAHVPDAVLEIGDERHAIEVELTRKPEHRQRRILDEHSARYNAIVYFCAPRPRSLLDRLQATCRWPGLRVLDLPEED